MGFFSRLANIFSSNAHGVLDRMENPENVLNHTLRKLEAEIASAQEALVKQVAAEGIIEKELRKAEETVTLRTKQAEQAILADDEGLAARAIADKQIWEQTRDDLQAQFEQARSHRLTFQQEFSELKATYDQLRTQRASLIARHNYAKSLNNIQKHMNIISGGSAAAEVQRMNHKVQMLEAEANARMEMRKNAPSLDMDFRKLSNSDAVQQELDMLKARLKPAQ